MKNDDPIDNPNLPAFPQDSNNHYACDVGLSKREYFAGLAMQGILSSVTIGREEYMKFFAETSVDIADALLKALKDKSP